MWHCNDQGFIAANLQCKKLVAMLHKRLLFLEHAVSLQVLCVLCHFWVVDDTGLMTARDIS